MLYSNVLLFCHFPFAMMLFFLNKHNCKGWTAQGPDLCRWDWVIVQKDYVPIDCGHILCWIWNMATLDLKHRSTNELTDCKQVTSLRIKKSPKGAILLIFQTATMISSIFTQLLSSTFRVTSIQCSKHHWFGRKKTDILLSGWPLTLHHLRVSFLWFFVFFDLIWW